jgi:RHS repeat-associated protein
MRQSARPSRTQNSRAPRAFLPSLQRCLVLFGTGAILAGLLTPVLGVGIAAASSVSSVSVTVSPSTAGSSATYTIKFTATSALSAGSGTVTFDAHTGAVGTVFPATASDYVITDSTHSSGSGTVTATPTLSNSNATTTFKVPKAITAGDALSVAVSAVTNPATANASATLAVSTSANTTAVTSPSYAITNAADGSGTMTVSPTTATAGATTTLTFTYAAAAGGLSSGAVAITVPSGWTAPSTSSGHAGYTTASTGTVSVASQVITVSGVSLTSGSTLTVTYGSGGGANSVTVPETAGAQSFSTSEKSTSSGTLTALSSSPSVTVSVSADGSGTMTVSPSVATESVGTTLTFTYTAATGGLYAGAVTITAPTGWSAPSTTSGHAGYTTASTGSVSVASQVITVSGVTLAGGSTMTLAYGSGGGSNAAIAPSTSSENTFSVQEKSTSGGTLTSIASSPQVNVIPPDGVGTMSVSPTSAIEAVPTTLTFTYTAPSSGLSSGAVALTVPSGWTAPTTSSGTAGYSTASTGTLSVAGQVVTVSGVTLSSAQSLTITYGAGGGAARVTPPTTLGNATFSTEERSSSSGTLTALSSSPIVSVVAPPDGTGTMTVSPTSVLASVPTTLSFTYTAATDGLVAGSVVVNVPSGWTAPSTSSTHAGYTTASVGTLSVAGQVITVSGLTLSSGSTLTITYGSGGGSTGALPPASTGAMSFSTEEESSSSGTLTSLSSSPSVSVNASPDGSGTETVSPSTVTAGSSTSLTFTYTAAPGGLVNGSLSLTVPAGWTAPSTTAGHPGYTTASTGTVSLAGQVITVSGVSLTGGSTMTVTYGAGGGANSVTPPASIGTATFTTNEKSTSSGTLTAISSSPQVVVNASPDGSGTFTVSPTTALAGSATTLSFTYTAAVGGTSNGSLSVIVPSGWSAPSTTSGNAGYTTVSTGTVSAAGQVISVTGVTLSSGSTLTLTYGAGGGYSAALTPSSYGSSTFTTEEASTSSGTLTALSASPAVGVMTSPDGSGTIGVSPGAVDTSAATTLSFTFAAATGGMNNGTVAVTVPSGWSAPSVTSGNAGYSTASTGTVSVAGQVVTVSGVSLGSGSVLTVSYGAGGGSSSAIAPSTAGSGTFATSEKSTASGTLTALSSSPSVSVLVPDGTGTASVSPTSVTESPVPTTLTFTFVAPASGINDGALAIAVPAGWTAPTTASSSAGYTTASSGTVSVSGQLITVSNLIMSANSQLTVTYGAGGGASSVLPSSTTGPATFVTEEQSSQFGMLTPIASSPVVQVAMLSAQTLSLNQGTVSTFAGSGTATNADGTGTSAGFNSPRGEAIIGNTLYVLDADAIRAVSTSNGAVSTIVGPASSGGGNYTDSSNPAGVTFDNPSSLTTDGVYLYFVDNGNIRRTDPATGATTTVFGAGYTGCGGSFTGLTEGADGNLYATALNNAYDYGYYYEDCVVQLNPVTRASTDVWSNGGNGWASMGQITGNATGIYFRTGGAIVELSYSLTPTVSTLVSSSNLADPSDGFTAAGNYLYAVTDSGTAIRRYDATTGAMTLVAGTPGTTGYADGSYYSAWFSSPGALVSDGEGRLYVADTNNNRLRTITQASPQPDPNPGLAPGLTTTLSLNQGTVSTFAGSGTATNADGTGTSAGFNSPRGEAIIGNTLYVLDADAIRAVSTSNGAVSTIVGPASSGGGNYTDSSNPAGVTFDNPSSLTTDGVYLYFVDNGNIRRTDPATGATTTVFGAGFVSGCGDAVAVTEGADGDLYATTVANSFGGWPWGDSSESCVVQLNPVTGGEVEEFITSSSWSLGVMGAITSNSTAVYFRYSDSIVEMPYATMTASTLVTNSVLGDYTDGFTAAGAYLYAVTNSGTAIRSYGATTLVAGSPGSGGYADGSYYSGWVSDPEALVSNGEGTLYVADTGNNRIRAISEADPQPDPNPGLAPGLTTSLLLDEGSLSVFAGSGAAANTDGNGTSAAFNSPRGEAIIGDTLYVLDADALRAVDLTSGDVSTVIGPASGAPYTDSATAADVTFDDPSSLTTDGVYLYFVDNGSIRRTDPSTGATTTVFGPSFTSCSGSFTGVTEGADGNLYGLAVNNYYMGWPWGWGWEACVDQLDPTTQKSTEEWINSGNGIMSMDQITGNATDVYFRTPSGIAEFAYSPNPTVSNFVLSSELANDEAGFTAAGNYLYAVTDSGAAVTRYDTTTGEVGNATDSSYTGCLSSPDALVSDGQGNLYVADEGCNLIDVVSGWASVTPQGASLGADTWGGGSPSEPASSNAPQVGGVDPATGDLSQTTTDISLPGAGVPLSFERTYDAEAAQTEVADESPVPPLGYGWSYNLGMSLSFDSSTSTATITEENGAQISFTPNPSSSPPHAWCPSSSQADYCATSPRVIATLNKNSDGSWTFTRYVDSTMTFTFSSDGSLSAMVDASGDTLKAQTYVPGAGQMACPAGDTCTAWVSSASGRELVLVMDLAGQLVEVFDPASGSSPVNAVSFAYSDSTCNWDGETPDLCSVTEPGNMTTSYTYDFANYNPNLEYDLLSETAPGESAGSDNSYDDDSGQVISQSDPDGEVTTFSYNGNYGSAGSTVVSIYPDGPGSDPDDPSLGVPVETTAYDYSHYVLTAEETGMGTSFDSFQYFQPAPASLLDAVTEDGDSNKTTDTFETYDSSGGSAMSSANVAIETDADGDEDLYAYNSDNQVWCTVDAAETANGVTCPAISPPSSIPSVSYPGTTIDVYNAADELIAVIDPLGNITTYSYTSGVNGVPNGLQYCSVDPVDYAKGVRCPSYGAAHVTGTTTSTFDSAGDTLTSTGADGGTTSYSYGVSGYPGLVSSETDPDGTTTSFGYDSAGRVTQQVVSFNSYAATTEYAYDASGNKYCEVDPSEYAKGVRCPALPVTTPTPTDDSYLGATITTYDADGQVIQTTNAIGGITYTAHDDAGEVYCTVGPAEAAQGVTCPALPVTPPTPTDDPYLGATITTYNDSGQVIQVTNPLGGITLTSYDGAGNVSSTTVESNDPTDDPDVTTSYTYNGDNQVIATTVGSGSDTSTTAESYDPNGNVYCSVSANAYAEGSSSYQCPAWQSSWISEPPNPSSLYSTAPTSSQANDVTTNFYNADGDLVQTTNPDVATSISYFDGDGRTTCTEDPVNLANWLAANPSGTYPYNCPSPALTTPPAIGSDPGYTTTIFDAAGQTISATDPLGDTTSYTYDPAGNRLTTTNPDGKTTTDCYYWEDTGAGCASGAPSAGGTGDSLYSETTPDTTADPSGETTTYTYYPGGAADTTTTPAGTTTDSYDGLGDLTGKTYSNTASGYSTSADVSYTYYPDGSRESMTDGTGTTTYGTDAMGDVTSQAFSAASSSGLSSNTVGYGYFSTGQLETVSYPSYGSFENPTVIYSYDQLGNMASETDWLGTEVTFSHDADGNLTSQDNDVSAADLNGTSSTTFTYDKADENTQATTAEMCSGSPGTLTQSFSGSGGSRNTDGEVTEDSEVYGGACSSQPSYERNYSYDLAGQVIYQGSVAQGSSPNNFSYDPAGNPTEISSHDSSGNFDTYDQSFDSAGEVTGQTPVAGSSGSASSYAFDTLGDLTSTTAGSSTTTYGYDQLGEMTSAAAGQTSTYKYTGGGLEAAMNSGGTTSQLVWNTTGSLALVLSDGTNDYVYGSTDEPVEQINITSAPPTANPLLLTYTDPDSSWTVTNTSGQQVSFYRYDAYGTLALGTPVSPFGFAGQYTDSSSGASGFVNMRARWYQPQTGQFTSVDPSFSETDQAYEYAGNDPINSSDPSGQFYICIGLFETIACSGGRSPSCHDWIGIGGYCATPPHQPVNGFSCFEGTVLAVAGGGTSSGCPSGKVLLSNELINYMNSLNGPPQPGNIKFEFDIVAQEEGCWNVKGGQAPLQPCIQSWFPGVGQKPNVSTLTHFFQTSPDNNILYMGIELRVAQFPYNWLVNLDDWVDKVADLNG